MLEPTVDADPLPGAELTAFVAASDAGSVQGAADQLSLTQSAVSKRLQRLELRLGLRLLDRVRSGVRPTAAGAAILPSARAALDALAGVHAAADEHRRLSSGRLTVAASRTIGEALLPGWLAEYGALNPGVTVSVDVIHSAGVIAAIRSGRADVGFIEGTQRPADLELLVVDHDEITVVVDARHRWAARTSLAPRELASDPYVARELRSGTREVADAALERAGVQLSPALEVDSTAALKRALASGGFALLSRLTTADEIDAGRLVAIPLRDVEIRRELLACRRQGDAGAAQAFWQWLTAR